MMFSVCVVLLVTVWQASAQAPGDEDQRCKNERAQANDVYPPSTRMLMDSRNYEELISGSRPHWQQLDVDGTGSGWTSTLGGLCAYEARACDFRVSTSQENWFFTQYINYLQAREVFVNVSAGFTECRLAQNPRCNQLYIDMYRYERNERNDAAARTTSNYQLIRRVQQPNGFAQRTYQTSFTFIPSGNSNGSYLGFKDTGTCVNIQRIQIYYNEFTPVAPSPVICPTTGLPPAGTTASVTCSCPANSNATSSLQMTCRSDGTCTGNPTCQCHEGYRNLSRQCTACPAGTYSSHGVSCVPCPANTTTSGVAVAMCPCTPGYFRAPGDGPSSNCIKPPTAVRNLRVISKTSINITIQWERPQEIGSLDYYYNVEHSNHSDISTYIHQKKINGTNTTRTITYNVTGLQPITTYFIRVSVHNKVSGNDSQNADSRIREVSDTTLEGIPSAPSSVQGLCTVVVWGQPSRTNGQLTGYDLRFYHTQPDNAALVSNRSDEIFRIIKETDVPSDQRGSAYVQVRGKTRAGPGDWSAGVPLGCVGQTGANGTNTGPTGPTTTGPIGPTNTGQGVETGANVTTNTGPTGPTTTGPNGSTNTGQGSGGVPVVPGLGGVRQGTNATISGYVQIWVLGVAVGGTFLVTAILVIVIVLVVVCICSRSKKGYEKDRTNGLNRNEYSNAMYDSK